MNIWSMKLRGCDSQGCGHFGASRGSRTHKGIDIKCQPGQEISACVSGVITKFGRVYSDPQKAHLQYVQITSNKYDFRMYYCKPKGAQLGDIVAEGDLVGVCQDLTEIYPGITNHIHFEIKNADGDRVDPTPVYISKHYGVL